MVTETMVGQVGQIGSSAPKAPKPQSKKKTEETAFDQVIAQMNVNVVNTPSPKAPEQVVEQPIQQMQAVEGVQAAQPQGVQQNQPIVPMEQSDNSMNVMVDMMMQSMQGVMQEQPLETLPMNEAAIPLMTVQQPAEQQQMPIVQQVVPTIAKELLPTQPNRAMEANELQAKPEMQVVTDNVETKPVAVQEQSSQAQEFDLSRSFRDAMQMVQQSVKKEKTQQPEELDIDALQTQVDVRRNKLEGHMKMQQMQRQKPVEAENVTKQLSEKMLLQLQKGEREFTVKLNPESLGEVTVKLLQKEGKMTLSIAAASETTVKLLNGHLDALKEAVRPMQVEVRQAVVQTQESDGQNMGQQMDMSNGGQFFNQSQQAQQQFYNQNKGKASNLVFRLDGMTEEPATLEQVQQAATVIANNLLDFYL